MKNLRLDETVLNSYTYESLSLALTNISIVLLCFNELLVNDAPSKAKTKGLPITDDADGNYTVNLVVVAL
ncbi:hypothetical protein O4H26_12310 [Aequorivita viscosa]|nr:hypothetical protein [Aequorivita viscosa]